MMMGHAEMLGAWFGKEIAKKYRAGQLEHGGDVTRKPCLRHLQEEVSDMAVYLAVVQEQWARVDKLLEIAQTCSVEDRYKYITKARNIISHGNSDGITEEELNGDSVATMYSEKFNSTISRQIAEEVLDG